MAERTKAPVLKTGGPLAGPVGSNPTPSATHVLMSTPLCVIYRIMTLYSGHAAEMERLQAMLGRRAREVGDRAVTVPAVLAGQGMDGAAVQVRHHLLEVEGWLRRWEVSLADRTGVLVGLDAVSAPAVPRARAWAGTGERRADELIDALQRGDLARTAAILATLEGSSPQQAAEFLAAFGGDMVAVLPLLVRDQGVPVADLARYLAPLAGALAVALPAGRTGFGIGDVMHDAARSEIGPAAYFAFADFADADLVEATAALMGQFHLRELPLVTPPYPLPDGGTAHPDPRVDLLRLLLDRDAATRAALLRSVVATSGAGAVVAPATPWGDGGSAIGDVVASVAGALDPATVVAISHAAADSAVAPAVRVAAWRLLWTSLILHASDALGSAR